MITENQQNIKKEIRKDIKNISKSISEDELKSRSILIKQTLNNLPEYNKAGTIHTYLSSYRSEVDTFPVIKDFLKQNKKVIVPVVDRDNSILLHSELRSINNLEKNIFKIWEPKHKYYTNPDNIDLIVVPGVAFDIKGNRLGQGKGYYDRFLADIKAPKIALVFHFQIVQFIPVENNDIPVDIIVSEDIIIRVKS